MADNSVKHAKDQNKVFEVVAVQPHGQFSWNSIQKIKQQYDNAQNHMEMALRLGSRFCQDCLEEGSPPAEVGCMSG